MKTFYTKYLCVIILLLTAANEFFAQTCTPGTRTCPTVSPTSTFTVCQNAPLTINSNVSGACNRPTCCYDETTSNLSINISGNHTFVSDLRYWVLNGTGPQGNKTLILYNAGNSQPTGTTNPITTNDMTSGSVCNNGNDFNVTFTYTTATYMPTICGAAVPLSGTYRPESPESTLNGIDIAAYNWTAQVFDCIGGDMGAVTSVTLTISNPDCNDDCIGCGGSVTAGTKTFTFSGSQAIADGSCSTATAATVTFTPVIVPPVRTVVWNGPGASNVVGDTYSPSTATVGSYVYTVKSQCDGGDCVPCTSTACGAASTPSTVTVNVIPIPTVNSVTTPMTYTSGSTVPTINFSGTPSGVVYNWTRTSGAIGLTPTSGTGDIPSFVANNMSAETVSSTFTVTPTYTENGVTCTGTPITFTIVVADDKDNDAVLNCADLDDDNDGILDTQECPQTSLLTNGTFTGSATGWTAGTAWSYNSNNYMAGVGDGANNSALTQTIQTSNAQIDCNGYIN